MSATLATNITANASRVRITGDPAKAAPFHARLGSEIVRVSSVYVESGIAFLVRGRLGTTKVAHASGTTFVVLDWVDELVDTGGGRVALFGEGAPTDGGSGTGALVAGSGSTYIDKSAGTIYVNNDVAATPAWQAAGTGGPGGSSDVRVYSIPFTFDTPDLLTGLVVYTPTVGDLLMDSSFLVTTAWNGTTPYADIATFVGSTTGLWGQVNAGLAFDLTVAGNEASGTGLFMQPGLQSTGEQMLVLSGIGIGNSEPLIPARFTATNPLKLVVTQDGTSGGVSPGSTQGEAILYLVIATPTTP